MKLHIVRAYLLFTISLIYSAPQDYLTDTRTLNIPSHLRRAGIALDINSVLFLESVPGPTTLFSRYLQAYKEKKLYFSKPDNYYRFNFQEWLALVNYQLPRFPLKNTSTRPDTAPLTFLLSDYNDDYLIMTPSRFRQLGCTCGFHAVMNMLLMHQYLLGGFETLDDIKDLYNSIVSSDWYDSPSLEWWKINQIDEFLQNLTPESFNYFKIEYSHHVSTTPYGTIFNKQGVQLDQDLSELKNLLKSYKDKKQPVVIPFIVYESHHNYSLVVGQDAQGKKVYVLMDSYYDSNRSESLVKALAQALK